MINQYLSKREFMFAFPSLIIGISILELPATMAKVTLYSDGWLAILIAGIVATLIALLAVRVASYFPGQPFFKYTSSLVTKPVAIVIAFLYIVVLLFMTGFINRSVAYIAQQYLFENTPLEVLAFVFLLVVIYAVAGTRIGLFRLNMLFLPIILGVFLIVDIFNIKYIELENYLPLFKTSWQGHFTGITKALNAYVGFSIGLFYLFMVKKPLNMAKPVLVGMGLIVFFYLLIFLITIGVFGNVVTSNMTLPALELSRKVDIPGAFFERVDAFVYTIWMMAIFNTMTMTYDITVLLLMSIFKKISKPATIFILGPIIYFISMYPKSMAIFQEVFRNFTLFTNILTTTVTIFLYIMIKWKGIRHNETF